MTTTHGRLRPFLMTLGLLGALAARPVPVSAQSAPASFNPLVNVSNTAAQVSDLAAVTLDGSTIYVTWREDTAGGSQIRLRRSSNGGVSFIDGAAGRLVTAVDAAETVYTVRVAAAGMHVYVLYTSGVEPRLAKARLARSADGGATFTAPVTLADMPEYGGSASADLAIDGTGVVHVVLEDRDLSDDIQYLISTDHGDTFSLPAPLAASPVPSLQPRVAARGSQVAVVWEEMLPQAAGEAGDVAFTYSLDAGASFGAMKNLSASDADSRRPAVAIANGIHAVWTEGDSVVMRTSLNGIAFTAMLPLAAAPAGESVVGAAVGSAVNTVHVSWITANADGLTNGPFYRRSTDGAGSFAAVQDLRGGAMGAPFGVPGIVNGTVARIVWPHSPSGFEPDADVHAAVEPTCAISWAAAVSGNWHDATKWSPAVVPGVGSSACITVEGAAYTVTVAGGQNAGELTIGHATSEVRPIVRITGSLTIGSSLVNSGELTFGGGGRISSTAGIVVNTEHGRFNTAAGAPALLGASVTNHGEVVFAANVTTFNFTRVFTNHRSWRIEAGATFTAGLGHTFTQAGGVLDVKGVALMISAQFNFLGGDITGQITLEQLAGLHIGTDAAGPGTFVFRFGNSIPGGTARLSGRARSNHTIKILACCTDGKGSISVTAAGGFTNAGTIILGGEPGNNGQGATLVGATLVNTGAVIVDGVGGGPRRLDMHVENRGTFDVQHSLGLFGTANRTFTNVGTMTVAEGANVTFGASFVFNQNGGALQNAGRMEMSGEFNSAGDTFYYNGGSVDGVVIVQGHSHLRIGAGSTGPGTFQFERNSIFGISANATFSGNTAPGQTLRLVTQPGAHAASVVAANGFTNAGTIVMDAASLVVTAGTLVNTGTIAVDATSPVIGRAIDANIDNRGSFTVRANLSLRGANRTFTNTGTVRVFGGATVFLGSTAVFNQQAGLLDVGGALVLNTEFNTGPDTFNFNGGEVHGFVTLQTTSRLNIGPASNGRGEFVFRFGQTNNAGGTMTGNIAPLQTVRIIGCCGLNSGQSVTAANGFTNFGTIALASDAPTTNGAGLFVTNGTLVNRGDITVEDAAGSSTHAIQARIENHGRIHIGDSITFSKAAGVYVNHGVLTVVAGRTLTIGGNAAFTNHGVIAGGGTMTLSAGTVFRGVGDVTANIVNNGRLGPGLSPGVLNVNGDYRQNAGGALDIEIAGLNPGSGFDRLNIAGTATLAGTLNVSVLSGFCVEGVFTIMTFGSRAGDFATKNGLSAGGGRTLVPAPGATTYALTTSGPPCNNAPVANDDSYSTDAGTVLSVPAPGVLGNDTDAQGDPLTAVLAAAPSHGGLALNPNGSFTYTPNADFSGTDSFTYRATDGQGTSGLAVVTITVRVRMPPAITAFSPAALTVGLVRSLTISGERFVSPSVTLRKGELEVVGKILLSSSTTIQAEFDVTDVAPGEWTVVVQNQSGQSASAPIFIDAAIIVAEFAWDGRRQFPVRPAGQVNAFPNYLTVYNVGLTDGMVQVTIELPHPAMRLRVGSLTSPLHTGGSVDVFVWAPRATPIRVPLYWGISPEDVNFPGMPVDPLKATFGQTLSFKVQPLMGLTAGSGKVTKLLVKLVQAGCGEIKEILAGKRLEEAAHEVTGELKESKPGTFTKETLAKKLAEKLLKKALEDIPGVNIAVEIAKCEKELGEALVTSWENEIKELSKAFCHDPRAAQRAIDLLQNNKLNLRGAISVRNATIEWLGDVAQGDCDDPPPPPDLDVDFLGVVAAAWDPNDKAANSTLYCAATNVNGTVQCTPYFIGPEHAPDPIEYVIQFENKAEANAPAENVVITDVLDDDVDPATLRIVAVSHPESFSFDVVGNIATFRFSGIDLPPNVESPEGQGDIMFTIEPRPGLASGTEIRNSASIVFDFNPPIVTPEVVHVVDTNPPITTATPSVAPNTHGWNNTDVTVRLRGDDGANGSGVKEIHVMVDGGSEQVVPGAAAVVSLTDEGVHTISYFAVDNVGNTEAGRVLTVRIDKTAPIVGSDRTPPNVHGWNNGDVTVVFTAEDALSGIDGLAMVEMVVTDEGANQSVERTFADLAGNVGKGVVDAIHIDKTPPVVTGARVTPANRHGWNNGPVLVSFTASDALSGIDGSETGGVTLSGEGAEQSASLGFIDQAGNSASATVGDINIDLTPPTIAGGTDRAPNEHGWYNADVAVSFTCADALSGVDTCSPTPQVISEEGKNLFRIGVVTDRAGNTSQTTVGGVNLDKTAPAVACSNSAPALRPPNHKLIAVQTAVTVTDSLSGALGFTLRQATSSEPDNGLGDGDTANDIQGFTIGTPDTSGQLRAERSGRGTGRIYSLVYDAADLAGNMAACTTTVTVPNNQGNGKK